MFESQTYTVTACEDIFNDLTGEGWMIVTNRTEDGYKLLGVTITNWEEHTVTREEGNAIEESENTQQMYFSFAGAQRTLVKHGLSHAIMNTGLKKMDKVSTPQTDDDGVICAALVILDHYCAMSDDATELADMLAGDGAFGESLTSQIVQEIDWAVNHEFEEYPEDSNFENDLVTLITGGGVAALELATELGE